MGSVADCSMLSDSQRPPMMTGAAPGRLAVGTAIHNENPCGQNARPSTPGFAGNSFQDLFETAFGHEEELPTTQEYRPRSESLGNTVLQVPHAADDIAALPRSMGKGPSDSNTSCSLDVEALCAENLLLRQEVERQRLQIQELAAGRAAVNAPSPSAGGVRNSVCSAPSGNEPDEDSAMGSTGSDSAKEPSTLSSAGGAAAAATAAAAAATAAAAAAATTTTAAKVAVHVAAKRAESNGGSGTYHYFKPVQKCAKCT